MIIDSSTSLLDTARYYASEYKFSVIPIIGKKAMVDWKIYQSQKPTDEELVQWFSDGKPTGLAVVTGKISDVTIVDADINHGADVSIFTNIHTPTVRSGGDGFHYYFSYADEITNSVNILPGIDVRGNGGYACLPPSKHASGKHYEWVKSPLSTPYAPVPEKILQLIKISRTSESDHIMNGVAEGSRNTSAASIAGSLLANFPKEKWESDCWPLLLGWNKSNMPPLSEIELRKIFESILEREKSNNGSIGGLSLGPMIVSSILSEKYILFHDQYHSGYISTTGSGRKVLKINSKLFFRWLSNYSWNHFERSPSSTISDVCNILEGKAVHEGEEYELNTRIAEYQNALWYDLGNGSSVKISRDGWSVVNDPPILFQQLIHQREQVQPERGGSVSDLCNLTNLASQDDRLLLMVTTIASFIPGFPHPIIIFYGPQGSGKSTPIKMLKSLIDPSSLKFQNTPDSSKDFAQQAFHHWLITYDNLSHLPDWLSDSLCRAVTGDGFSKRELYTNDDDVIYNFQRVIAMNGINIIAERADLLERSIIIGLDRITDKNRRPESELFTEFESIKPWILGAIFDAVSKTLKLIHTIQLEFVPRMADFAKYGCAISQALGYTSDDFMRAYLNNINIQNEVAIESNNVATCVVYLMEKQPYWEGQASDLLTVLTKIAEQHNISINSRGWPKDPPRLSRKLMLAQTNLLQSGINVRRERRGSRVIVIQKISENTDITDIPSQQDIDIPSVDGNDGDSCHI